jgi:uncharacterized membrane protein YoaK (UPF0700 family)
MFRHKGKSRSLKQNLGIASLLSFVAGIVNVTGFLAVKQLTTNVTGHFAYMVEEAIQINFSQALFYFLYILFFLAGSFFSNLLIEFTNKFSDKNIFIIPVLTEVFLLSFIAFLDFHYIIDHPNIIACTLLFAMGLQNSLVTTISNSIVRTTHLTGLFTDLGIELSQLFFFKSRQQHQKLISSIKLRLSIITAFFFGGIIAGTIFNEWKIQTLLIGTFVLLIGLTIDYITVMRRMKMIRQKKFNSVQ